ncbi:MULTISPECIES: TIR domain-containing protein [unclassified Mucilaginibacter]|uniref:TIR domain-containing protein n=1 Tax=unclassified Mucilaginibacter TaxID=2617802 RepID=UPI0033982D55
MVKVKTFRPLSSPVFRRGYTGAAKGSTDYKPRARQNVVFEHGYLIGKIGRGNVCALVKDDVETPNDISGVVYIKMDDHDGWHLKVAKELRSSGYNVDFSKL